MDVTATDPKVSVTSIWETDAPQPILAPTDTGYWAWSIVAPSPGQIKLIVRVSVFHTDTKDLLEPSSEYVATVDVGKDFSYFAGGAFPIISAILKWLLSAVAAAGGLAAIGAATKWLRRKKKPKPGPKASATKTTGLEARRTKGATPQAKPGGGTPVTTRAPKAKKSHS